MFVIARPYPSTSMRPILAVRSLGFQIDSRYAIVSPPVTELSIILPAINEADNLSVLLPRLHDVAKSIGSYEILVVDGGSTDDTPARATMHGAKVHFQKERGYGKALQEAFDLAQGKYIVT